MVSHLRHFIAAAGFLCIIGFARPSNAEQPYILRMVAPDGSEVTVEVFMRETTENPPPPRVEVGQSVEEEVLSLTNERRAEGATCAGQYFPPAAPVGPSSRLRAAAREHSLDMGQRNYFDHTSLDGRSPGDRLHAVGFHGRTWGENIYAGPTTAEEVVDGWMKSPGHCKNIMNPHFRYLGVGHAIVRGSRFTTYWTQDFGG